MFILWRKIFNVKRMKNDHSLDGKQKLINKKSFLFVESEIENFRFYLFVFIDMIIDVIILFILYFITIRILCNCKL